MIPTSRGGDSSPENTVMACRSCNTSKGDCTPLEWFLQLEGVWQRMAHGRIGRDGPVLAPGLAWSAEAGNETYAEGLERVPVTWRALSFKAPPSLHAIVYAIAEEQGTPMGATLLDILRAGLAAKRPRPKQP